MSDLPFRDRDDAGERLAAELVERGLDADLVLAIPRGGLPLGRVVADALDVPLDVVVAKKVGAPGNPEYAIGAVASDGSVWKNREALRGMRDGEAYFERRRPEVEQEAKRKAGAYRGDRPAQELAGKTVVVVDDGVATGSTLKACLARLENAGVGRIVLAVPVGPPDSIRQLERAVDDLVCLARPRGFRGVGQFYRRFDQVSDDEAIGYLETTGQR